MARPRILLADEPTGSLDQATGQEVLQLLFDEVERLQSTLVMVTHDEKLLARFDRVIQLDKVES